MFLEETGGPGSHPRASGPGQVEGWWVDGMPSLSKDGHLGFIHTGIHLWPSSPLQDARCGSLVHPSTEACLPDVTFMFDD